MESETPGFTSGRKLGVPTQDTAELLFDCLRIPDTRVVDEPDQGFVMMMRKSAL